MALLKKHIEFIRLVASGTTQTAAYKKTCGNKSVTTNVAKVKGSQLAKKYANEILEAKQKSQSLIEDANKSEDAKSALSQIVSQAEADAKVFKILTKEDDVDDFTFNYGKVVAFTRKPTQLEIQKAYDLYCKRFGSNLPNKVDVTSGGDKIQPLQLSPEAIQAIAKELDKDY